MPEFDPNVPTANNNPTATIYASKPTTALEHICQRRRIGIGAKKPTRPVRAYSWGNPIEGTIVKNKRIKVDLEKENVLQGFVQQNLMGIFGLKLIKPEFRLGGQRSDDRRASPRPDTLAFDEKKECFVVIEYKKEDADRIYRQLSTYASVPDRPAYQMEMINTYSKVQKENDLLAPLNPAEICWKNYYCIYVSLDISDELIKNLRPIRKGSDIRMYEIHLFEGVVVLYRVDADDASIDDGLDGEPNMATTKPPPPRPKPPSPTPDLVSILDLSAEISRTHKPQTLILPNRESVDVKSSWSAVMREVALWLEAKNRIKNESQSGLLRTKPLSSKTSHFKLRNGLYVNLNFVSSDILKRTQKLLDDIGYEPSSFKITLKNSKIATRPAQPTQPPDLVPILDLKSDITNKHKPAILQFPDRTSTNDLGGWATVLAKVATWLSKKGHIKKQLQSDILCAEIHHKPSHRPVHLANGLYLNLNINATAVLANTQKLLKDIGHEPNNFKIGLKDEIA